jgi:hypothetical protein
LFPIIFSFHFVAVFGCGAVIDKEPTEHRFHFSLPNRKEVRIEH